jgi:hypothetical protein
MKVFCTKELGNLILFMVDVMGHAGFCRAFFTIHRQQEHGYLA